MLFQQWNADTEHNMIYVEVFDGRGFEFDFITDDAEKIPEVVMKLAEPLTWYTNLKFGPIREDHENSWWFKEKKAIGEVYSDEQDEYDPGLAIVTREIGFNEILRKEEE